MIMNFYVIEEELPRTYSVVMFETKLSAEYSYIVSTHVHVFCSKLDLG